MRFFAPMLAVRQRLYQTPHDPVVVTPVGPTQTATYTEDASTDFPNPERGWYVESKYWGGTFGVKTHPAPVSVVVSENRPTLEMYYVYLRDFLSTDVISSAFLSTMAANYAEARSSGVKLVVRHAYNRSDSVSPIDVSISRMKAHIDQLAPYWDTYKDVIAVMQGGFMGPWGEQWWSTGVPSNLNTPALQLELLDYLMASTPSTMMVQWRYLDDSSWVMARYPNPSTYAARFTGTDVQRVAHYNDSFANTYTMLTYHESGTYTTAEEMAYLSAHGPHVALGGEGSQDVGDITGPYSDGDYIIPVMEDWGWDYLNSEYPDQLMNKWSSTGYLAQISRRLGYRLVLNSATVPRNVVPGDTMMLTLDMRNAGFGKVFNTRPLDLVFVGDGGPFTARVVSDARRNFPLGGQTTTMMFGVLVPSGLTDGEPYALHLRFPDLSTNLASDNRYAIRLANTGMWDASTGRHDLGLTVTAGAYSPPTQTENYTEDETTDFPNPERGWYIDGNNEGTTLYPITSGGDWATRPLYAPVEALTDARLAMKYVRLDNYRSGSLGSAYLADHAAELASFRNTGRKAILRYGYGRGEVDDAPFSVVMGHISELASIWQAYADVIAVLQLGFIGHWGEWGLGTSSNNLLDGSDGNGPYRFQIIQAVLDATPSGMQVAIRYPRDMGPNDNPTTRAGFWDGQGFFDPTYRFTTEDRSRFGLFNDCYLNNVYNGSWWDPWDGTSTARDEAITDSLNPYTMMGGEACTTSPYGGASGSVTTMERTHIDYLNSNYHQDTIDYWAATAHPDGGTYLAYISRRLGYRLVLDSATAPTTAASGGTMSITFNMRNVGFGKVTNVRPMDLVFVGPSNSYQYRLTGDARRLLPLAGQSATPQFQFTVPAQLNAGDTYALYVAFPDPYASHALNSQYAIRLANASMWNTAWGNNLNMSVAVT